MISRVTRFTDYLTRTFNVKGRSDPMAVIPDVMPTIGLVDPTDVEHHWTRNEVLWGMASFIAAGGAGTYTTLEVAGSGDQLTVIEAMLITASGLGGANIGVGTAALTGAVNRYATRADSRAEVAGPAPGVRGYAYTPAAALPANFAAIYLPANAPQLIPIGMVLDADDRMHVSCVTANLNLYVTLYGYDRPAEDWERL